MKDITDTKHVAISVGNSDYSDQPPFSPDTFFSEYQFNRQTLSEKKNTAYKAVRNALGLLGLDAENYGCKNWNPLGQIIKAGDTVVLKPNFVRDFRETLPGDDNCLITHGSVIRATVDYVYIALKGKGRIMIADAPQNDANFDEIKRMAGLNEIKEFYKKQAGFEIEVYDLRPEQAKKVNGVIVGHEILPGDPAGYVKVNLDSNSMFAEIEDLCEKLYGSEYDTSEIRRHQTNGVHEYLVSKTILDADCIINLPKLKTHKKTGVTLCMKNLVGINGNKNWLPHHREGTPCQGGDQFSDDSIKHKMEREVMKCFRRFFPLFGPIRAVIAKPIKAVGKSIFGDTNTDTIRSGNWYGNDTTWRMVIDLNRILMFADTNGNIMEHPTRKVFHIVDGIVGGEGNGPLDTTSKPIGIVVTGSNMVAVDLTCARLMGFDYKLIPVLYRSLTNSSLPLITGTYSDIVCRSNNEQFNRVLCEIEGETFIFKPHFGWKKHIEINNSGSKS
ncbi:MAG: DUF362 domain-containing protein [Sedimentisphaerales bacterium]|nr:DUF362 domain-containing protein [Sedimentisphaerales bacterium]